MFLNYFKEIRLGGRLPSFVLLDVFPLPCPTNCCIHSEDVWLLWATVLDSEEDQEAPGRKPDLTRTEPIFSDDQDMQ